ncbi:MAG: hypothetical protein E6G98_00910 [Bacillati bacterium ANGP1]|uniref:Organic solvent tolerance-like N-terminal domain-containing protein n=1 Tax=Candidatus Segetimicrobium genomatis TaxID=2569760 RepID=A0A537M0B3_9BACT|nr:MAG: hypothetical protein E6G98_00910 [Terrabacteria group bacterium ANGP1]
MSRSTGSPSKDMWRLRSLRNRFEVALVTLAWALVAAAATGPATAQQPLQLDVTGATRVEFNDSVGVWELYGNPVTVRRGLVVLKAPAVRYNAKDQIVIASSGVSYGDQMLIASAGTVTVWLREGRAVAENDVQVAYRGVDPVDLRAARVELLQEQRSLIASGAARLARGSSAITADQIEYDHAARRAVAAGAVQARTPDGRLGADRVEARLATEEFIADGHVVVTRDTVEGHAAHAVFRQQAGQVELSGDALVHLGRNMVQAQVITIDLRARRVTATGRPHLVGYPAAP